VTKDILFFLKIKFKFKKYLKNKKTKNKVGYNLPIFGFRIFSYLNSFMLILVVNKSVSLDLQLLAFIKNGWKSFFIVKSD